MENLSDYKKSDIYDNCISAIKEYEKERWKFANCSNISFDFENEYVIGIIRSYTKLELQYGNRTHKFKNTLKFKYDDHRRKCNHILITSEGKIYVAVSKLEMDWYDIRSIPKYYITPYADYCKKISISHLENISKILGNNHISKQLLIPWNINTCLESETERKISLTDYNIPQCEKDRLHSMECKIIEQLKIFIQMPLSDISINESKIICNKEISIVNDYQEKINILEANNKKLKRGFLELNNELTKVKNNLNSELSLYKNKEKDNSNKINLLETELENMKKENQILKLDNGRLYDKLEGSEYSSEEEIHIVCKKIKSFKTSKN